MGQTSNDLLPVKKRTPKHLAWLRALLSAVQWDHNLIFRDYANGVSAPNWTSGNNYSYLDRIIYVDGAVYELQNMDGLTPSTEAPNISNDWIKILDSFIGARERARYNSQKLMLEYLLNRRFQVGTFSQVEWEIKWISGVPVPQSAPPYQQIYIKVTNNSLTDFWLSNGNGLVSYMGNSQSFFLGNAYAQFNPINFAIYVPTALYAHIGTYQLSGVTAEAAIRSVVDNYNPAGGIYQIITY